MRETMQLSDLPAIEREALDLLLQGDEILRRQLSAVSRVIRTESGAGIYVVFELDGQAERLADNPSFHVSDVFATSASSDEIGFILFVKEGLLDYMEAYVYSDAYPSYDNSYSLSRQSVSPPR